MRIRSGKSVAGVTDSYAIASVALAFCLAPGHAAAQSTITVGTVSVSTVTVALLVVLVGAVCFAVVSAVLLMRTRSRVDAENAALRDEIAAARAKNGRLESMIADDERMVAWSGTASPLVVGRLGDLAGAPSDATAFVAFGTWLQPESAARLSGAIDRLREAGDRFNIVVASKTERLIEASGRTVGGEAVARFRDLSGDRLARAEAETQFDLLDAEMAAMRTMFAVAPTPIWLRDETGQLVWVNAAYAEAVGAEDSDEAAAQSLELLDEGGRRALEQGHRTMSVVVERLPAVIGGARRMLDVSDIATATGSGGIAIDVSTAESAEAALRREVAFNTRILDHLATAVAVIGADRRVKSYNAAFLSQFELEPGFLNSEPTEVAVLDRLRAARKLPEQADYKTWRTELLSAYESKEPRTTIWHLPDGQALRVVANPNPQGGMTWVYENVTERLDLERGYNALMRVQGETLDHLAEGVAVFGSDGQLKLHNPAFALTLDLDPELLETSPHVAEIVSRCRQPGDSDADWQRFTTAVTGFVEARSRFSRRLERSNDRVIDYTTAPLPEGQTMVTVVDVTDSVQVERALRERAEALEAADTLKNAFVHHVSYELRSPLTNIVGFTELLLADGTGPLNDRQLEYVGYVKNSADSLQTIVNDILDLATIDAGIMELELSEVGVAETVAGALEGVKDRIEESGVTLVTSVPATIGTFVADGKRVRQILFNLIANAIAFSPKGGRVGISARRKPDVIEFTVTDNGPGIPEDFITDAFGRFASQAQGEGRGGAGLGLAIVKSFAELHGGTVEIESGTGAGAKVICRLPVRPGIAIAAE